jgi:hypothetical protein
MINPWRKTETTIEEPRRPLFDVVLVMLSNMRSFGRPAKGGGDYTPTESLSTRP